MIAEWSLLGGHSPVGTKGLKVAWRPLAWEQRCPGSHPQSRWHGECRQRVRLSLHVIPSRCMRAPTVRSLKEEVSPELSRSGAGPVASSLPPFFIFLIVVENI